jgi:hypothetical protein
MSARDAFVSSTLSLQSSQSDPLGALMDRV